MTYQDDYAAEIQAVTQPAQWTEEHIRVATPDQLLAAIEAGQLADHQIPPRRRTGHWHDAPAAVQEAAKAKAATAPDTLTQDDIAALDHRTILALAESGGLTHLGIGAQRRR